MNMQAGRFNFKLDLFILCSNIEQDRESDCDGLNLQRGSLITSAPQRRCSHAQSHYTLSLTSKHEEKTCLINVPSLSVFSILNRFLLLR